MIEMCSSIKTKGDRRRGAVLLIVLGVILLASWILIQILAHVGEEIALRGVEDQNDAIKASAFQALEIVMGVLAEIKDLDGALYCPAQGWGAPLAYAGFPMATAAAQSIESEDAPETNTAEWGEVAAFAFPPGVDVEVSIRDESGRFPLNKTSEERWKLLFEEMEIQSADAVTMVDSLLDWIDADDEPRLNGAEAGFYQRREPPYLPANSPIDDLLQLQLIEGFDRLFFDDQGVPNDRFRMFRDCVTTMDIESVNYNTATPRVLDTLAEERDFESRRVADYLAGPDLEPGTADDRVLRPDATDSDLPVDNNGKRLDFSGACRYLTVHITSRSVGTEFHLSARLDTQTPSPGNVYPMTIMDLQTKGSNL